jgi:hypothetical protein
MSIPSHKAFAEACIAVKKEQLQEYERLKSEGKTPEELKELMEHWWYYTGPYAPPPPPPQTVSHKWYWRIFSWLA